jgi:D-sedoheptulose 7-phosphate isomerase
MFAHEWQEHAECMNRLISLEPDIVRAGEWMAETIAAGGKILVCGNGGSAADAQHFAAELIGRFEKERRAWPCISLTTDTSNLTAIGNDYGFDTIFSRQVAGIGRPEDLLVGISTSGNSPNVVQAVLTARGIGMKTIGLLGKDGGELRNIVDHGVVVSHARTARIQECHVFILHTWALIIEHHLS